MGIEPECWDIGYAGIKKNVLQLRDVDVDRTESNATIESFGCRSEIRVHGSVMSVPFRPKMDDQSWDPQVITLKASSRRTPVAFLMFVPVCDVHGLGEIGLPISRVLINKRRKRRPFIVCQGHNCQHRPIASVDTRLEELIKSISGREYGSQTSQLRHVAIVFCTEGTPPVDLIVRFTKRHAG